MAMKKLLLIIVLIVGCDNPTADSTHDTDHTHEGVCTVRHGWPTNYCYPDWSELGCLREESFQLADQSLTTVAFFYMSCEEFCDIPDYDIIYTESTSYLDTAVVECKIIYGPYPRNN